MESRLRAQWGGSWVWRWLDFPGQNFLRLGGIYGLILVGGGEKGGVGGGLVGGGILRVGRGLEICF